MQFSLGGNPFVNVVLRLLIVLMLPIGLYSYTIVQTETARYISEQKVTDEFLDSVGLVIQEELDFLSQDLESILNSKEIKNYIKNPNDLARQNVANYFALLSTVSRR
jgi:hypothetical protein